MNQLKCETWPMEVTAQVLVITRPSTQYVYVKEEVQTYS